MSRRTYTDAEVQKLKAEGKFTKPITHMGKQALNMSKDELDPQKVMAELNDWKTQFDMVQGRANGILSNGATTMLQRSAEKISILLGENQRLKKQLEEALAKLPTAKELPKTEMPAKKK